MKQISDPNVSHSPTLSERGERFVEEIPSLTLSEFDIYPQFKLPMGLFQIQEGFSYEFRVIVDHTFDKKMGLDWITPVDKLEKQQLNFTFRFSKLGYDTNFMSLATINLFKALEWIVGWIIIKYWNENTLEIPQKYLHGLAVWPLQLKSLFIQ